MNSKSLIALPVYNEEKNLQKLIPKLVSYNIDILAVDDGSNDESYNILSSLNINTIKHQKNIGIGKVHESILKYANSNGYQYIITIDSDGQHDPTYIPDILKSLKNNDFVVGNRFHNRNNIPLEKISSNLFASMLIESITGKFIQDVSCGFRGYNVKTLNSVKIDNHSFNFIFQMILEFLIQNKRIDTVNMPANYKGQTIVTKSNEIISLLTQAYLKSNNVDLLDKIELIVHNKDFEMEILEVRFLFTNNGDNSYVIGVDRVIAENYYKSKTETQWN